MNCEKNRVVDFFSDIIKFGFKIYIQLETLLWHDAAVIIFFCLSWVNYLDYITESWAFITLLMVLTGLKIGDPKLRLGTLRLESDKRLHHTSAIRIAEIIQMAKRYKPCICRALRSDYLDL